MVPPGTSASDARPLLADGLELVPDAVASLDERVVRRAAVDLLPHLADEDVDRAVAAGLSTAPHAPQELVARDDAARRARARAQEPQPRRRGGGPLARAARPAPA